MGCTGYASYNIHGNGLVEVNGAAPSFPKENVGGRIEEAWAKYGTAIRGASRRTGVPQTWILAILMQESNGGKSKCSPCAACNPKYCETHLSRSCCAFSVMQITGQTARGLGIPVEALMQDDTLAISAGATLLRGLLAQTDGDFVKAAAAYNGGYGVLERCGAQNTFGYQTNGDYPMDVVKWSNTALSMNLPIKDHTLAAILGTAGFFAAGAIYTGVWKPNWI